MINCNYLKQIAQTASSATTGTIRIAQEKFHFPFPAQYISLLVCSNGFTAREDVSSLRIYSVEELFERNETYEVSVYLPEFIMIGDDGGGRGIFISTTVNNEQAYRMDMGSMLVEYADILANNLNEWICSDIPL